MKRFFLALILLCSLLQSVPGSASGSSNVYLPVSRFDFSVSLKPIFELDNDKLYDLFESNKQTSVYVIYVDPYLFDRIHLYNCWGYGTVIDFEKYGVVEFSYYSEYKATLGRNSENELVMLVPKAVNGYPPKTVCNWDTSCDGQSSDGILSPPN